MAKQEGIRGESGGNMQRMQPSGTGWSWFVNERCIPLSLPLEENVLDIAFPGTNVWLGNSAKTTFAALSEVLEAVCCIYITDIWELTRSYVL